MNRPKLHKGRFRGTDSNGNDRYAADYYSKHEVDEYIKELEAQLDKVCGYLPNLLRIGSGGSKDPLVILHNEAVDHLQQALEKEQDNE